MSNNKKEGYDHSFVISNAKSLQCLAKELKKTTKTDEALGEPPDDSKTVFGFAKQGNAAVGTYFVKIEFSSYFAGSSRTGAVSGCFEIFEG